MVRTLEIPYDDSVLLATSLPQADFERGHLASIAPALSSLLMACSGQVEFRDPHLFGVFAALKDPELFAQVHCQRGFVEWPGDIDLATDAMYEEIKTQGVWVLE
jgi:hypothetical protein